MYRLENLYRRLSGWLLEYWQLIAAAAVMCIPTVVDAAPSPSSLFKFDRVEA
jgi:hypothetical protein